MSFGLFYNNNWYNIKQAIEREKQLKEWKKDWKINLIKTINSELVDLAHDWEYELGVRENICTSNGGNSSD